MFPLQRGAVTWILGLICFAAAIYSVSSAENRVVCYYTNWSVYRPGTAKFNPQNINPYLCTHLIYAFGGFTKDNTLKPFDKYQDIEQGGYAKFTGLKTYNKELKTMLAIGGWNEGSSRFSPLVANAAKRQQLVKNTIKYLRQNHFDGLDLDWEYPAFRDGGKARDRENYAQLVQELREEFDRESSKTGRPRLLLTMAVPAGIEYVEKGYDIPKLNKYLDWFNLLTYDFHSAFEPAVNHHAPLFSLEEESEYNYDTELNIDYSVKFYLNAGADKDKLVLGIPTYGRSYTLFNPDSTDIGSPADGPGEQGDATREKGYLAYYEICDNIKNDPDWEVVQPNPNAMGPYAFKDNQWVGYDDEAIVRKKSQYVLDRGLGGIMFWAIDNDDFRGQCGGKPYPLIEAAKDALLNGVRTSDNDIGPPTRKGKPSRSRSRQNPSNKNNRLTEDTVIESKPSSSSSSSSGRRKINPRTTKAPAATTTTPSSSLYIGHTRTTPAPPTTPDPGSDFKCEDEGFFPHPRDCKKYFWCLDSGPSNLGIVAHQFTCPSGLFFNKDADSCDYTRNVKCTPPKDPPITEPTFTTTTTTTTTTPRPRITSATSRNTFQRPTTTTTTAAPEEEYEYEDEVETGPLEGEEDPRVIKELIDLIKKVGGVEELEKQLRLQEDGSLVIKDSKTKSITTTPATISKSLYEKVLSRASNKFANKNRFSNSFSGKNTNANTEAATESASGKQDNKYSSVIRNSRPGPQNDGLDKLAEFDSFLKEKPKYVTLNRARPTASLQSTKDEEDEEAEYDDEEDEGEEEEKNKRDSATTPHSQYVNIRRQRPQAQAQIDDSEDEQENEDNSRRKVLFNIEQGSTASPYVNLKRQRFTTESSFSFTTTPSSADEVQGTTNRYKTFNRFRPSAEGTTKIPIAEDEVIYEEISDSPIITTVTESSSGNGDDVDNNNNNNNYIRNDNVKLQTTTPRYYQPFERSRGTTTLASLAFETTASPTTTESSAQQSEQEQQSTITTTTTTTTSTTPSSEQNDIIITHTLANALNHNLFNNRNRTNSFLSSSSFSTSSRPLINVDDILLTTSSLLETDTATEIPLTTTVRYVQDNNNDNVNLGGNDENEVKNEISVTLSNISSSSLLSNRLNNSSRINLNRFNFNANNNNRTQYQTANRLNNRFATPTGTPAAVAVADEATSDNVTPSSITSTPRSRFRSTTERNRPSSSPNSSVINNSNNNNNSAFPASVYAPRPFARRTRPTASATTTTSASGSSATGDNSESDNNNNNSNSFKRVSLSTYSNKASFTDSLLSGNTKADEAEGAAAEQVRGANTRTTPAQFELTNDIGRRRRVLARGRSRFTPADSTISETSPNSFIKSTPAPFSRSFSLNANTNNNNNNNVNNIPRDSINLNSIKVKSNGEPESFGETQTSTAVFDESSVNFRTRYDSLNKEEDESVDDEPKIITEESLQQANKNKVQINTYSGIDDNSNESTKKPDRIILTLGTALSFNGGGSSQNPSFRSFINNIDQQFKGQPFSIDISSTTLETTTTPAGITSSLLDNTERVRNSPSSSSLTTNPFRGRTRPITTTESSAATSGSVQEAARQSSRSRDRFGSRSRGRPATPITTTTESIQTTAFDGEVEEGDEQDDDDISPRVTAFSARTRPVTTTSASAISKVFDSTLRPLEIANELDFTRPFESTDNDQDLYTRPFTPSAQEESSTQFPFDDGTTLLPSRINELINGIVDEVEEEEENEEDDSDATTNRVDSQSTAPTVDVNSESSYRRRPSNRNRNSGSTTPSNAETLSTTNRFSSRGRRPNAVAFNTQDQQITNVELNNNGVVKTEARTRPPFVRPSFRQRITPITDANYDDSPVTEDDSVSTTPRGSRRRPVNRFDSSRTSQDVEQRRRPGSQFSRASTERNVAGNDFSDVITETPRRGSNRFAQTRRTTVQDETETSTRSSSQFSGRRRRPSNFNRAQSSTTDDSVATEDEQTESPQNEFRRRPANNRFSARVTTERTRTEFIRRPQGNRFSSTQDESAVDNNDQEAETPATISTGFRRRPAFNRPAINNQERDNDGNDEDQPRLPQTSFRRRPVSRFNAQNNNNNNNDNANTDNQSSSLPETGFRRRPFNERLNSVRQRPSFNRVNIAESEAGRQDEQPEEEYDDENQAETPRPIRRKPPSFTGAPNRFNLNADVQSSSETPQKLTFRSSRKNSTRPSNRNQDVSDSKDNSSEILVTKLRTRPAYLRPVSDNSDDLTASQQFNQRRRPSALNTARRVIPANGDNLESATGRPENEYENELDVDENTSELYNDLDSDNYSTTEYNYDESSDANTRSPVEIVSNRTAGTRYGGRKVIRKKPFNVGSLPTTEAPADEKLSTSTTETPQYRKRKLVRVDRLTSLAAVQSSTPSVESTSNAEEISGENNSTTARQGIKRRKKIIRKLRPSNNSTTVDGGETPDSQELLRGGILEQQRLGAVNVTDANRRGKKIFKLDNTAAIDAEEYIQTDDDLAQDISEEPSSTTAATLTARVRTRRPGVIVRTRTQAPRFNETASTGTLTSGTLAPGSRRLVKVVKTLPTRRRNSPFRPQNRINLDPVETNAENESENEKTNEEAVVEDVNENESPISTQAGAPARKGFVPRRPSFRTSSTTTEHPASRKFRKNNNALETTTSRFPARTRKVVRKFNATAPTTNTNTATTQFNTINDTINNNRQSNTKSTDLYTSTDDYNTNIVDFEATTSLSTNAEADDESDLNNINKLNTLQDIGGRKQATTTTQKPTTLHHVFAIDYDESVSSTTPRIRTAADLEQDNAEEIVQRNEKLVEINRIVEIYSKQNRIKINKKNGGVPVTSDQTNLVLEQVPKLDRLGEISRLTSIKLIEHEYGANNSGKSETLNESETVNTGYARQQKNAVVTDGGQAKKSRNIVFANTVFNVETSTIALEGLFNQDRQGKDLDTTLSPGDVSVTTPTPSTTTEATPSTTQRPRPKILRPPTPLLRPESNETNPLVISIANLDQVILSKINNKRPVDRDGDASPSAKINTYFKNGPVYRPPNDVTVVTPSPAPATDGTPQKQTKALDENAGISSNSNDFVRKNGTPLLKVTVINPRDGGAKSLATDTTADASTTVTESNEPDMMTAVS